MNKRLYFIFLSFTIFAIACVDENARPMTAKPTMEKEAFINLLVDARMLEGAYAVRYQRIDSASGMLNTYYDQVFQKHGTTREQFRENFIAYSVDTELMSEIEDSVFARLDRIPMEVSADTSTFNRQKPIVK
ncbi:MAG: hypothetical protein RL204_675 [Bacteroidota bacterium]|jgi:hypothetical protein